MLPLVTGTRLHTSGLPCGWVVPPTIELSSSSALSIANAVGHSQAQIPASAELRKSDLSFASDNSIISEHDRVSSAIDHCRNEWISHSFPSLEDLLYIDSQYHPSFSISLEVFRGIIIYTVRRSLRTWHLDCDDDSGG